MSEPKNHNYDAVESQLRSIIKFLVIMTALGICTLLITYILLSARAPEKEQAIADIEAEQIAESSHHTAVVTAINMSSGQVTLDNGDIIPADDLKMTPHVNDVLSYTKSFEYEISDWDGTPKRTDQDAFLNVQSVGQVSE